jgi:hypothetical protein
MRYSLRFRLLIAALALLAGNAAPAVAISHGFSHAREAAHDDAPEHHHHTPEHDAGLTTDQVLHPMDGHGHAVLDPGTTKRLSADVTILASGDVKAFPAALTTTRVSFPGDSERVTGKTATGPPPSLRAPPIL